MITLSNETVGWMFMAVVLLAALAITGNISVVRWALQGRGLLERQRDGRSADVVGFNQRERN